MVTWRARLGDPIIDPELPRHCDLCKFVKPMANTGKSWLEFTIEARPNKVAEDRWPTRKAPGKYRAEITLTADNAMAITKGSTSISRVRGQDDPTELAENGLRVEVR